jgi:hypothetical protein
VRGIYCVILETSRNPAGTTKYVRKELTKIGNEILDDNGKVHMARLQQQKVKIFYHNLKLIQL